MVCGDRASIVRDPPSISWYAPSPSISAPESMEIVVAASTGLVAVFAGICSGIASTRYVQALSAGSAGQTVVTTPLHVPEASVVQTLLYSVGVSTALLQTRRVIVSYSTYAPHWNLPDGQHHNCEYSFLRAWNVVSQALCQLDMHAVPGYATERWLPVFVFDSESA